MQNMTDHLCHLFSLHNIMTTLSAFIVAKIIEFPINPKKNFMKYSFFFIYFFRDL